MSVVVSLLRAIDRADGEALVMHVGEKPYVVTASGHAELAANALTVPAMNGMLDQLLPADSRQALNELGAVEYHLPPDPASPGTRYSVVAARGGDDIWIEVRRRKEEPEPTVVAVEQAAVFVVERHTAPAPPPVAVVAREYEPPAIVEPAAPPVEEPDLIPIEEPEPVAVEEPEPFVLHEFEPVALEPEPKVVEQPVASIDQPPAPEAAIAPEPPPAMEEPEPRFELSLQREEDFYRQEPIEDDHDEQPVLPEDLPPAFDFTAEPEPEAVAAAVVPMARVNVRFEAPRRPASPAPPAAQVDPLHYLIQVAVAQGASALYVAPQARPSLRVDGEVRVLDEAPLTEAKLEASLRALLPSRPAEGALPTGEVETVDVPGVGRVECLLFRDHHGLGATFRKLPGRAITAEQSGLSAPIQALCTEPEGLLLVAGARGAGKSTLIAGLVDQINQTRRDHVITVENEILFVHENRTSFISQREARDDRQFTEAVHAAMREAPDVLVIDGVMTPEVAAVVLDAAADGHMVLASSPGSSTADAIERFVGLFGDGASNARELLAEHLRGVVLQALLRKTGGGRASAREVFVNVPSVAPLIADARFDQLITVLNSGRRIGMVPLNDALVGLVQSGAIDARHAYRKSPDPKELLSMLGRAGIDTVFAEPLN